jgi:2-methylaconitate cis-trans-isomerase PrpF
VVQWKIPAIFMRGGTSRAIFFRQADLPSDPVLRDRIILATMGSPDSYGRQLDGMGGGISSLSKVAIVGPPTRPDADVNYTFGQVSVTDALVDYTGNCGNISSAVGPYAIDEALTTAPQNGEAIVRIHNTNTRKIIVARVPVQAGQAAVEGDFALQGVSGTGARIALEFLDPGGAVTGKLLPTGEAQEALGVPGMDDVTVSIVDATNPMVFVRAVDLGLQGTEPPEVIDRNTSLTARLEQIRATAAVRIGLARDVEEASRKSQAVPKIALVAPPLAYRDLSGAEVPATSTDICARVMSMGKAHRAFALTAAMCLAVAARIPGTVVQEVVAPAAAADPSADIRLGHASGVLPIAAAVREGRAEKVVVYRTARRLMEGFIRVPVRVLKEG